MGLEVRAAEPDHRRDRRVAADRDARARGKRTPRSVEAVIAAELEYAGLGVAAAARICRRREERGERLAQRVAIEVIRARRVLAPAGSEHEGEDESLLHGGPQRMSMR